MSIYIASKTKHAARWRKMRDSGRLRIVSTWINEAGAGETSDWPDLWRRCIGEAKNADALVLYREEGEVLKGALVEAGAALACGVPVFLSGDCEGYSFQHHPGVTVCDSIYDAFEMAERVSLK